MQQTREHSLQHIGVSKFCKMDLSRLILIGILNWSAFVSGDQQQQGAVSALINNYRTCLGRFDVHTDTIIQTEDSRKMGASFLSHLEAANRDECLRVCCETDRCDVFVFEEKFKGSCFLFQCGPPDDFRCQFASHANYSIAVMSAPLQRYKPVEQQTPQPVVVPPPAPHLSQHELELANLKSGRESFGTFRMPEMGNNNNRAGGVVSTTSPLISGLVTTTAKPSICGRFQFQCHSGECIAIYNVCDNVPQCEDGSDETAACPSPAVSNSNKKHNSQMEEPPLYRVNPQNPQQQPPPHRSELNYPDRTRLQYPGKIYENQMMAGGYNNEQNLNAAKYSQQDMTGSIEKPPPLLRNREEPGSAPRYYPSSSSSSSTSNQGRNPESPPMLGKELAMQSNMIYSNINDPQENRPVYDPHGRPLDYYSNGGAAAAAAANGFRDKYYYPSNSDQRQQQLQQLHPIQPVDPLADGRGAYNNPSNGLNYLPTNNNNNNWPSAISNNLPSAALNLNGPQQPQQLPPVSPNAAPQSIPAAVPPVAVAPPNNIEKPLKTAKKPTKEESSEEESDEDTTAPSTPQKKIKGKSRGKHRKLEKGGNEGGEEEEEQSQENKGMPTFPPIYQQLKAIGSELDAEILDHDGHSDRPTGAVVSLVIGVFLTAVLAIFIGCRMKTVGRRIRRTGKGPYAHDADFLVNGMYL